MKFQHTVITPAGDVIKFSNKVETAYVVLCDAEWTRSDGTKHWIVTFHSSLELAQKKMSDQMKRLTNCKIITTKGKSCNDI
jgi:hypothetical protein